ncbi:ROK family protein, partial [bacterium]|nr:ROK family protein [bacterium]
IDRLKIKGVGIGVPGPLDKEREIVLNPPNLKVLGRFPLKKVLERELSLRVKIENDANCFVLGEAVLGIGKKYKKVIGLTLGSGVGGGIVFKTAPDRWQVYTGAFGSAGEFGHMTIKFDGVKCSCGSLGCLEEYASEKFFKRKSKYSPKEIENQARKGNKKAIAIYREFGNYLGIGIANLVNILDPDIVVLGGSISKASPFFLKEAQKQARKRILSPYSKRFVKIKISKLGDFAPAIGAGLLWQQEN